MSGDYSHVDILGRKAIHFRNDSTTRVDNGSRILLPSADVHTVSLWFYVTRVDSSGTWCLIDSGGAGYIGDSSNGGIWDSPSYLYLNGRSKQPMTRVPVCFASPSSEWQHLTVIATKLQVRTILSLFANTEGYNGIDINVGRIQVYDRILSQYENYLSFSGSRPLN